MRSHDGLRHVFLALVVCAVGAIADAQSLTPSSSRDAATQTPQTPPTPEHTGLTTLAKDTVRDFAAFPQRRSTWVILGVGGAAALAVHPVDDTVNAHLVGHGWADKLWKPGDFVGGVGMAIAPVAVYGIGRYLIPAVTDQPRANKWSHLGLDLVRAQIVDEAFVQGLKLSARRTRPNGAKYSFPSGHAAATFALAAVIERHLGYRFALPTIAIASYVGSSRLHDNVHYLSDVTFGAALGTAVGWTVVGRHGRNSYAVAPTPVPGGIALTFTKLSP